VTVVRVAQIAHGAADTAPLLERERELAAIERLLEHAAAARGQLVVVEGPAGIGKTTLLAAAATLARERGATVLAARGSPLERAFAFGVVRDLFERLALEEDGSPSLLSGAAGLARPALAAAEGGAGVSREDVSYATLHGLYWLTANVAARAPLLLSIDDCHWADGPSLRYLAHLGARIEGVRALVLVALRSGDPPAAPELVGELVALSTRDAIRPAALGPEASAELVRAALGEAASDRFCLACRAATGGNPLLLRALVASIAAEDRKPTDEAAAAVASFGADGVARVLARQLARLPAGSEPLLRALCVLGANPPLRHAASLAGLELVEAAETADALRAASILSAGGELDFAHPVLRAAITERIGPQARAIAHARAAELLAAEGAPPERLAAHLLHTHPCADTAVVATLRSAAAVAADRGAPETAALYLQRALDEPPPPALRGPVQLELGLAQLAARVDAEATPLLAAAVAAIDPPPERAQATLLAGRSLGLAGRFEEAAAILESGLPSTPVESDTELLVEAELLGNASLLAARVPAALERAARLRTDNAPAGVARDLMLVHRAVRELRDARPAGAGWELLDRALAAGALLREESIVVAWTMMALFWTDRFDEAEQICSELVRASERRGSAYLVAHLSFPRAFVASLRGELRQAEADARFGLEQKLASGLSDGRAFHLAPLLNALVDQGDLEGAELALARANVPARPAEQLGWALVLEARGRLRLAQNRPQEALADLLEAGRRWEALAWSHPGLTAWRSEAARALARLDEPEEASRLAAEQLELARATELPRPIGAATLAAGLVATPRPSLRLLQEAVDLLERTQAKLELARALVELGAALRRKGRRAAARETLRRGLELAHRAGARPLAEHARGELVAAGARPRRPVFTGVDALTASELRVARLAADGLANREIAERLFVTERTVETHLRHVFQKLDITSRLQLPEAFGSSEPAASAR
jgi:DNA-binding CsgD family transcriptional regulator